MDPEFGWSEQELRDSLKSGQRGLWAVIDADIRAFVVLELLPKDILYIHCIAGEGADRWGEMLERELMHYAQEIGAKIIRAHARAGLARKLERRGWRATATIMELRTDEHR